MTIMLSAGTKPEETLTLDQIHAVACAFERVELAGPARALLQHRRDAIVKAVRADPSRPLYGFNRGFGSNVRDAMPADQLETLQRNLILSHATCVGDPAPVAVVRAAMLLRARSLARGHSSVRPEVVEALVALLNARITPVVPMLGSVSASGDLAPLSHIALAMIGEGDVIVTDAKGRETRKRAAAALKAAGIAPLKLEMKEGLALNNGCQYATAWTALAAHLMRRLIDTAAIATAFTGQVMFAADTPYRRDLHALRPHPGAQRIAERVSKLFEKSPIRDFHRRFDVDGEVQDPYNLRCAAQVLGACEDLVARAVRTVEIEANSVTDNPIDVSPHGQTPTAEDIVSGGHFHGMPVAVDAYGLIQAAGIAARLINMRCVRYTDAARNRGLGPQLKWPGDGSKPPEKVAKGRTKDRLATENGMLIPEYVSGGVANWIWGLAMPSHLMSVSTDSGQEDHVSMAANVAIRAHDAALRLSEALAIELAYAAQAAAIRKVRLELKARPLVSEDDLGEAGVPREGVRPVDITPALEKLARRDPDAFEAISMPTVETCERVWWRQMGAKDARLSPACERVCAEVARHFPLVDRDRYMAEDFARLAGAVRAGAIQEAAGTP
ncbi:MAG: aromatic amino acid ammonia-lyase [Parvularculaceae bacterium]